MIITPYQLYIFTMHTHLASKIFFFFFCCEFAAQPSSEIIQASLYWRKWNANSKAVNKLMKTTQRGIRVKLIGVWGTNLALEWSKIAPCNCFFPDCAEAIEINAGTGGGGGGSWGGVSMWGTWSWFFFYIDKPVPSWKIFKLTSEICQCDA